MASRAATRHYDVAAFQKEYRSSLRVGVVMLPAGHEAVADELRLDVVLPDVGRIGPMDAQVINRFPDGSTALRLPDHPAELKAACKQLLERYPLPDPKAKAPAPEVKPPEVRPPEVKPPEAVRPSPVGAADTRSTAGRGDGGDGGEEAARPLSTGGGEAAPEGAEDAAARPLSTGRGEGGPEGRVRGAEVRGAEVRGAEARGAEDAAGAEVEALRARVRELEAEVEALRARVRGLEAGQAGAEGDPAAEAGAEGDPAAGARGAPAAADGPQAPRPPKERGLPILDLSRLAPWRRGTLADRGLRDALMALALEKLTGMLTVSYPGGLRRWGYWYKGGPVGWRAEPMQEGEVLGVLLFRAQQITKEQLQQSLQLMEQTGVRQGEALIEMGVISFPGLVMLLQKQTEFVLQQVLRDVQALNKQGLNKQGDEGGEWTFHALPDLPEKFVAPPVRVAQLLYRQLRQQAKELPAEGLAAYLRPNLDRYVYFVPGAARTLEEMKLSAEEAQFTRIVGSTSYRARELFAVSNLARSATAATLWCFNELSLLDFRAEEAGARSAGRFEKMLEDRRRQMNKGTLFDRLELHWICTRADVDAAWKKFQQDFSEEATKSWPANLQDDLAKWRRLAKDAYDRLSNDTARREYRVSVTDRTMVEQSAEMLFKKGDMAIMKNALNEALDCMIKANELMPANAEYKEGLQRVRGLKG